MVSHAIGFDTSQAKHQFIEMPCAGTRARARIEQNVMEHNIFSLVCQTSHLDIWEISTKFTLVCVVHGTKSWNARVMNSKKIEPHTQWAFYRSVRSRFCHPSLFVLHLILSPFFDSFLFFIYRSHAYTFCYCKSVHSLHTVCITQTLAHSDTKRINHNVLNLWPTTRCY